MEKIQIVITEKIRPLLQSHQGDIELIEVTVDGVVKVRLTGACATCPSGQQTMTAMVEKALQQSCPEISGVIAVQQVSNELITEALKILRKGTA